MIRFLKIEAYFKNLSEKFKDFEYMFLSSIMKFRNRDRLDVLSTLDVIAQRSTSRTLDIDDKFRGFCKVSESQFYHRLEKRCRIFRTEERRTLKREAIQMQCTKFDESVSQTTMSLAKKLVAKHLGLEHKKFIPATVEQAAATLKLQTSAGFPWFSKKGRVFDQIIDTVNYVLEAGSFKASLLASFPCYISYRVQQRPSDVKLRLIYVYSGAIVVLEQLFLVPLLRHFLAFKSPYVIGNNGADLVLRWNYWQERKHIVSLDWTAFEWPV